MRSQKKNLFMGHHPSKHNRMVYIKQEQRKEHMLVLGRSGWGKSYFIENAIRQDIEACRGVCVLDPSGDLYNRLLRYCHINRFKNSLKDRLILINPREQEWSVGLNYLEILDSTTTPSTQTNVVARAISKAFADEKLEEKPRLDHWLPITIFPLIKAGLTLREGPLFLEDADVREKILAQVGDYDLIQQWKLIDKLSFNKRVEYLESVSNRFQKFIFGDAIKRIVGQKRSTINFREAMDKGMIILVNLAEGGPLSPPEAKLLGIIIIDRLAEAAKSRVDIPERKRKRMYFYIDEFHKYLCEDVARGLKELRKFGLSFVLASQNIASIRAKEVELYGAIQQGTTIKVCFSAFEDDAELIISELYPNYLAGDIEKRRLERTIYRQKLGRAKTYTKSNMEAESNGIVSSSSYGDSLSGSRSISMPARLGGFDSAILITTDGRISTYNSTSGDFSSKTKARARGEVDAPFYYQIEDKEVSNIEDYTPEEKRQKLMSLLVNLPKRHAFVKVIGEKYDAVPFITADLPIKRQTVLKDDFQKTIREANIRSGLPIKEVDKQIAAHRNLLLGYPVKDVEFQEISKLGYNIQEPEEDHFDQESYEPDK